MNICKWCNRTTLDSTFTSPLSIGNLRSPVTKRYNLALLQCHRSHSYNPARSSPGTRKTEKKNHYFKRRLILRQRDKYTHFVTIDTITCWRIDSHGRPTASKHRSYRYPTIKYLVGNQFHTVFERSHLSSPRTGLFIAITPTDILSMNNRVIHKYLQQWHR